MLRFPKSARLSESAEFAQVKREGTALHGTYMVLSVWRDAEGTRIGFITSKRTGGAVQRNKVRRRMREIVRVMRPRLKAGVWMVIIARRKAVDAPFEALRSEWLRLATRAAILA